MISIRLCREEDCERIFALNHVLGYDISMEQTRTQLHTILARPTDRVFVACAGETVAGYIQVSDYEALYMDSMKNIIGLVVDDRYQGQGVGKALLQAAEQWARDCGCKGIRLNSNVKRHKAHGFYESCGYVNTKDQKNLEKHF